MGETFTLDTSGAIRLVPAKADPDGPIYRWTDLDAFTQGYIEALFAEHIHGDKRTRWARNHHFRDLAPEALGRIIEDCAAIIERTGWTDLSQRAGREAWRLRQNSTAFYGLLPLTVTLNDDGKVSLSPTRGGDQ